jgi:hypothetical protein
MNTIKLFGYVKDISLEPIAAAKVLVRVTPVPQYSGFDIFSTDDIVLITNEEGYFETYLAAGLGVTVIIPVADYLVSGVLPLKGEISVSDLDRQPTKILV